MTVSAPKSKSGWHCSIWLPLILPTLSAWKQWFVQEGYFCWMIPIVHDSFFLVPLGGQNIIWIFNSGCLLSRKVWWVVWIGSFCPKLRYFTDQNGPNGGPHQNEFWPFLSIKMNVTNSQSVQSRWKMGSFV